METNHLPVAIIGAGPIGLAAAAHLLKRGETPLVFEAGPTAGASVLQWGHVRLFSLWRELLDRESVALLKELSHPEANFYIVGMKSYGRAPTFLTLTGYEQVRSIVAALTGDDEAAHTVELVLPENGGGNTSVIDWVGDQERQETGVLRA